MKLFHNADINDLNSIVEQGLLPMSVTKNNRWSDGKRAGNSMDVVYLFDPVGEQNSFARNYGLALIEVETEAVKNDLLPQDVNKGLYVEYTTEKVEPSKIRKIYLPEIFRSRITGLSESVLEKVKWVEMRADRYVGYISNPDNPYGLGGTDVYEPATDEFLEKFAKLAPLSVDEFNYFHAYFDNEMHDLYNVKYII